jgi:hypothetical protein
MGMLWIANEDSEEKREVLEEIIITIEKIQLGFDDLIRRLSIGNKEYSDGFGLLY